MESLCFRPPPSLLGGSSPPTSVGLEIRAGHPLSQVSASGRPIVGTTVSAAVDPTAAVAPAASRRSYMFPPPIRRLLPGGGGEKGSNEEIPLVEDGEEEAGEEEEEEEVLPPSRQQGNWVLKILRVRSIWMEKKREGGGDGVLERDEKGGDDGGDLRVDDGDRCVGCHGQLDGCEVGGEEIAAEEIDQDSFSRLLRRVSLADSKLYAQLSYLGNMAYKIPKINPVNLLKYHGLRFVTSSLEKKSISSNSQKEMLIPQVHGIEEGEEKIDGERQWKDGHKSKSSNSKKEMLIPQVHEIEEGEGKIDGQRQRKDGHKSKSSNSKKEMLIPQVHEIEEGEGKIDGQRQRKDGHKSKSSNSKKEMLIPQVHEIEGEGKIDGQRQRKDGHMISASAAYQIAASAASYVQSHMRSILPFRSTEALEGSDVASFVVTTDSVTAVVSAKEETKQAVAKDLNSVHCSPCEWFICDDDINGTRFFVIQGSESVASWQANLLFEPVQFEGLDVLVHRGIYEAAKGIYEQMLPEVQAHLRSHGNSATLRFTGHSLGGSLALLVNLMLLIRREAPPSSLLPIITFGSPCIMCGGNYLLRELGLPPSYVQAITMHRDIVPRAFSCSYPDHVAQILKAINVKFRDHPCLNHQKFLYAPMGELLILQPDEKFSPHHHLLPSGSGLYILGRPIPDSSDSLQLLHAAQSVFLNSPHPLQILSDSSAYGPGGIIYRDHDVKAYVRAARGVVLQELKRIRKTKREHRRQAWWSLVIPQGIAAGIIMGQQEFKSSGPREFNFSGIFQGGRDSLKRFGRLVATRHEHMLIMLLLPAQLLFLGSLTVVSFS